MESLPFFDVEEDEYDEESNTEKAESKCDAVKVSYIPLNLEKFWFISKSSTNKDEHLTLCKYRAHAEFQKKNFENALKLYEQCENLLPANANLLLREVYEGKAKCLIEMKQLKDAEDVTKLMLKQKGNPQDSSLWSLLSNIFEKMEKWESAAECLKKCLDLHPEFPQYWIRLAGVYSKLASRNSYKKHLTAVTRCESSNASQTDEGAFSEDISYVAIWYFVRYFSSFFQQEVVRLQQIKEKVIKSPELTGNHSDGCTNAGDSTRETLNGLDHAQVDKISQDIGTLEVRHLPCCCFRNIDFIYHLKSQFPSDNSLFFNELTGQDEIGAMLKKKGMHENGFLSIQSSNEDSNDADDEIHFLIWKLLMQSIQCCAAVNAWVLLQKSVQSSKEFVKEAAKAKLASVEKYAVDLLVSKSNVQRLSRILENKPT